LLEGLVAVRLAAVPVGACGPRKRWIEGEKRGPRTWLIRTDTVGRRSPRTRPAQVFTVKWSVSATRWRAYPRRKRRQGGPLSLNLFHGYIKTTTTSRGVARMFLRW